jgi:phosphate transport system substrate-binding protein
MKKTSEVIIALVLLVSFAFAKEKEPNEPNTVPAAAKIVISGTGDSQELLRALAADFMKKHSGCEIEVPDSVGSGRGIKAVTNGQVDLARVARLLNEEEKKSGLAYLLFAKSPVAFAVHAGLVDINNITTEQIVGIYSGKITDWSRLGAKTGKIYPLIREAGDSSLQVLDKKLPGFADINNPVAKTVYTTPATVAILVEHKNTIGFMPLPAMFGTQLKILKVNGVYPSIENIRDRKYEFVVPLGIVYKGKPGELAQKFIDFLYSKDGQKIITNMGALPSR